MVRKNFKKKAKVNNSNSREMQDDANATQGFAHGLSGDEPVFVEDMTIGELANKLKCSANSLIVEFMKKGVLANKNQVVKKDQIVAVLQDLNVLFEEPKVDTEERLGALLEAKASEGGEARLPVIAVVGHVDHGKTSLLDHLRKSKVVDKEIGGITQHVAAYEVATQFGNLVFIDTPGHEAFSLMRERGVLIADLVVLIVALDDGVKPQTVESIKKIQEFGATTVVALNKVDKAQPERLDVVKRELSDHGILPDEWGGDVPVVAISAKTGQGVDELLEVIRLQADILDLKTSSKEPAQGFVLESMMEHGRGAVATIILHKGKICRGDYFVCGNTFGKVSSMENYAGKKVDCVGPSVPVIVAGFSQLPQAGTLFEFATQQQIKKFKSTQSRSTAQTKKVSGVETEGSVRVVIKTATLMSKEAVLSSLEKLHLNHTGKIIVVDAGIGDINEGNLELAATTGATVYGLGIKAPKGVLAKAPKGVEVRTFNIIYKLLEDLEDLLEKNKVEKIEEKELGAARVKAIFNIKSIGTIAGAAVESGQLEKNAKVRVYRGGEVVGSGVIKTLQKEKTAVQSIAAGSDCAFSVDKFSDWKIGDTVHCFVEIKS